MQKYLEALRSGDVRFFEGFVDPDRLQSALADWDAILGPSLDYCLWDHGVWPFIPLGQEGYKDAVWHMRHNTHLSRQLKMTVPTSVEENVEWTLKDLLEFERIANGYKGIQEMAEETRKASIQPTTQSSDDQEGNLLVP